MLKRRINIGLILLFLIWISIMIIPNFVFANPSYEDYTTYTEVEPDNRIQITENHIDIFASSQETAYLYTDKGIDYFESNFEHRVNAKFSITEGDMGIVVCWALTNDLDDIRSLRTASKTFIHVVWVGGLVDDTKIGLYEEYNGNINSDWYLSGVKNTWYYFLVRKVGTALSLKIYDTAESRDAETGDEHLLDTLSIILQSDYSFQYIYGCSSFNYGFVAWCTNDIENLDLQEIIPDDFPFYSNPDNDGVTQVGEVSGFSCFWEDDLMLDTCYFWTNNTGSGVNHTLSVSGVSSWANKTLQLNFTIGVRVEYKWFCSDNASQWNITSIYFLVTTSLYITFNFNNSTMGKFYVNYVNTANETQNSYSYNESILLDGIPLSSNYSFLNFTWIGDNSLTNNYNYYTSGNNTIWCYFGLSEGITGIHEDYFVLGFVIAGCSILFMVIVIKGDKKKKEK